jgi:RNA polymerase sigma factor (sigma-70 family)
MKITVWNRAEAEELEKLEECWPWICKQAYTLGRAFGVDPEDLMQESCLTVLLVMKKFDPAQGKSFFCYASQFIRGRMINYCVSKSETVRSPRAKFGKTGKREMSLSEPVGEGDMTLGELLADSMASPEDMMAAIAERERLQKLDGMVVHHLTPTRRKVWRLRCNGATLAQIGKLLGMGESGVLKHERMAIGALRLACAEEGLT